MRLPIKIAFRYLRSKKAHSAVNIISIVSVCGVVIATAALVCVLSVFNGFGELIDSRLSKLNPDVQITAAVGKTIAHGDSVAHAVASLPGVELAMPTIESQALAVFAEYQMPLRVKGVPANYDSLTCIRDIIIDGEYNLGDRVSRNTVIGVGPAIHLFVRPGYLRMLNLYAPKREGKINLSNPVGAFRADSVFVSGIFELDNSDYDHDVIFVPIDVARNLFDYEQEASAVEIKVSQDAEVSSVIKSIKKCLPSGYVVKDRLMQNQESFRMINVEKWVSFLLLAFILMIATFNVIGALTLLIVEKQDSIEVFRSMGANNKQIVNIFVAESWIISAVGALGGVILGVTLCLVQQFFGIIRLNGDAATLVVSAYPVQVQVSDIVTVFVLVLVVGFFTSAISALTVNRLLKK